VRPLFCEYVETVPIHLLIRYNLSLLWLDNSHLTCFFTYLPMSSYRIHLSADHLLFEQGDVGDTAFLIEEGQIEITLKIQGETRLLNRLGPGVLVGEMAMLDDAPRTATARAMTDCILTPINRDQFAERLEASDPVIRALLLSQLARYRAAFANLSGQSIVHENQYEQAPLGATFGFDKMRLESHLRHALANRELEIHFQPIQEIDTRRIAGYEALMRWTHPERGVVSPTDIIALAEETALIIPLGDYVVREVCSALRYIADQGILPMPFITLNVSGRQLDNPVFIDSLLAAAKELGVQPNWIKLELTESLIVDFIKAQKLITRCAEAGIPVALDDFGTGYSNLTHLHELKFDILKLDQAFIHQIEKPRCLAIVQAIIHMARSLGCDIVAEGVETAEQLTRLKTLGCRFAQGYLIGRAMLLPEAVSQL